MYLHTQAAVSCLSKPIPAFIPIKYIQGLEGRYSHLCKHAFSGVSHVPTLYNKSLTHFLPIS